MNEKRFVVALMEFNCDYKSGEIDQLTSFDSLEEAKACEEGISMMNNLGLNYCRILDQWMNEMVDDLSADEYNDVNGHSSWTFVDLNKIKEKLKDES